MGAINVKQRSRITDRHFTNSLKVATTDQEPHLKLLAIKCKTQTTRKKLVLYYLIHVHLISYSIPHFSDVLHVLLHFK